MVRGKKEKDRNKYEGENKEGDKEGREKEELQ